MISGVNLLLRKLYNLDLVLPRDNACFFYGLEAFSGCADYELRKVKLLLHRVLRYVYSVMWYVHISHYVIEFLGCSFSDFVNIRSLLHFYKLYRSKSPEFMLVFFKFNRSTRNTQITIPRLTSILEKSFHVRVARIFDGLPHILRSFHYSPKTY